jgi:WD40 repeat protein
LKTLNAHKNAITAVVWNASGDLLASSSDDGFVKIWRIEDESMVISQGSHKSRVRSLSWSPDGTMLVSAGDDANVRVWKVKDGEEVWALKCNAISVAWSNNQKLIGVVSAGESGISLLNSTDGTVTRKIDNAFERPNELRWSKDDKLIVCGSAKKTCVWDVESGKSRGVISDNDTIVSFSPDAGFFVSAAKYGHDGSITICDSQTGSPQQRLDRITGSGLGGYGTAPTAVDWSSSSNGKIAVCYNDGEKGHWIKIWEGKPYARLEGHSARVRSLRWSPDGAKIVTSGEDETLVVWDVATGKSNTIRGHLGNVHQSNWSNANQLVSASEDKTVRGWDAETGKQTFSLEGHEAAVYSACWSPDNKYIVSGSADRTVRIWQVDHKEKVLVHTFKREDSAVYTRVAWSPDGKLVAGGSNSGMLDLWDPKSGEKVASIKVSTGEVAGLRWSPDSSKVAIISNYMVRLYEIASKQLIQSITAPHNDGAHGKGLDWSADGSKILCVHGNNYPKISDVKSGNLLMKISTSYHTRGAAIIRVGFSPNRNRIAWAAGNILFVMQLP